MCAELVKAIDDHVISTMKAAKFYCVVDSARDLLDSTHPTGDHMTDHTTRPESWDEITLAACDPERAPDADCLMELRARVERLEQAQQPAPSTPAGQKGLFYSVAAVMSESPTDAILAMADWLERQGEDRIAVLLRMEVGR
jgi:hypothetical protein